MYKISAAIAAFGLLAAPALAADAAAQDSPASIRVSAVDLDLSRSADQQLLKARVAKAIAAACNPSGVYYPDLTMDKDCARDIAAQADTRILSMSAAQSASATTTRTPAP